MPFESRIKIVALKAAMDLTLKGMYKNPERCARNLIELVCDSYPSKLTQTKRAELFQRILEQIELDNAKKIKEILLEIIN